MTDETTPKTAEEFMMHEFGMTDKMAEEWAYQLTMLPGPGYEDIVEVIQKYSRHEQLRVAQQVRQQCAEEAEIECTGDGDREYYCILDRESILSVDIEQFIK